MRIILYFFLLYLSLSFLAITSPLSQASISSHTMSILTPRDRCFRASPQVRTNCLKVLPATRAVRFFRRCCSTSTCPHSCRRVDMMDCSDSLEFMITVDVVKHTESSPPSSNFKAKPLRLSQPLSLSIVVQCEQEERLRDIETRFITLRKKKCAESRNAS